MRFRKLSLRNFRGVEHAEVEFRGVGVTVIAGPNEIGKSSLAEAIDLLFDYQDSSGAQPVRAVQPVHRDDGTEIRLEFEAGSYRLTYLKCFNRGKRTELTVHEPRPENLTGRAAHDRVLEILNETADIGLWNALRIQQDRPLDYPKLESHGSLTAALDRAAGHARSGEAEATLYDAIKEEYGLYYSPGGQPRSVLKDTAAAVDSAGADVARIEADLERVGQDVQESRRLVREISDDEAALVMLEETARAKRGALDELGRQERCLEQLQARQAAAASEHRESAFRLDNRRSLVDRVQQLRLQQQQLVRAATDRVPEAALSQEAEDRSREELETARTVVRAAEATHALAAGDYDYRRAELDHAQLSERLERVRAMEERAREAEGIVEGNPVTHEVLEQLQEAHLVVEKARSAVAAGSPEVRITALKPFKLGAEAEERLLDTREEWSTRVQGRTDLNIGDVARVCIEPTADSRSLRDDLQVKEARLSELFSQAGVEDLAAAARAHADRGQAERILAERDRVLEDNLRDLSQNQLAQKVERLQERIGRYPLERGSDAPMPADYDEAAEHMRASAQGRDAARAELEAAQGRLDRAQQKRSTLETELVQARARVDQQSTQLQAEEQSLSHARAVDPDDDLAQAEQKAAEGLARTDAQVSDLAARIAAFKPEGIRLQAENATAAVDNARRRIADAKEQRIRVQERLDVAGERGLGEARAAAELTLQRGQAENDAVTRRAAAARLLFETFDARRAEAQAAYVGPLTEHIETLGRFVFGDDFRVEMNENLEVSNRTMNGRTVPFESLSGGAREQISVLARIACALTVVEDGGVPLIFDDALGNSDAERLESLGAVLTLAGRTCQVIILTCAPERYRHVGTAEVVSIRSSVPVAAA
jgi:hypothetical protein